jgi:hypothetical protein
MLVVFCRAQSCYRILCYFLRVAAVPTWLSTMYRAYTVNMTHGTRQRGDFIRVAPDPALKCSAYV